MLVRTFNSTIHDVVFALSRSVVSVLLLVFHNVTYAKMHVIHDNGPNFIIVVSVLRRTDLGVLQLMCCLSPK